MEDIENANHPSLLGWEVDEIIQNIVAILEDRLAFLLVYGSTIKGESGVDVDLYVVTKEGKSYNHVELERVDMICISRDFLLKLVNEGLLDPALVTEPLFTGLFVAGDRASHEEISRRIRNARASPDTVSYLFRRSFTIYLSAITELEKGRLLDSVIELTFAISYYLYAQYYLLVDSKVVTLEELLSKVVKPFNVFFNNLFLKRKYYRRKPNELSAKEVSEVLSVWETLLTSGTRFFAVMK